MLKGDRFSLDRVDQDLAAGRLWKGRDRLLGMLDTFPGSPKLLDLLGEVYYRMGDWPEAGRYWFLTERDDPAAQAAIAAFQERYGVHVGSMLTRSRRTPLKNLGPIAAERVRALGLPERRPAVPPAVQGPPPTRWAPWRDHASAILVLVFLVGPWLAGFLTLLIWLVTRFAPSLAGILRLWLFSGQP